MPSSTPPPFIIYALPRSRTYWLSRFLTYGPWHCGHEELRHCRSLDDVRDWFKQPCIGTAETAAAPWWRLVQELVPGIRTLVIRRDREEVFESLLRTGVKFDHDKLRNILARADAKLDQIQSRVPGAISVPYGALTEESVCGLIFTGLLDLPHDSAWWSATAGLNLQINLPITIRYMQAHAGQLARLTAVAKHHLMTQMALKPVSIEGMTFQEESFSNVHDAEKLIASHCVRSGETPDGLGSKNLDLLAKLDALGCLHVMTARANGRMFGYLVHIVGPSIEDSNMKLGTQTVFYVDPAAKGIGLKLQRAAQDGLRQRGVNKIDYRAGTRADGPRMGTIFRRLGAAPAGDMYSLRLEQ